MSHDPRGSSANEVVADVAIVGGGIAALWILDALDEAGYSVVLLEPGRLGQGQTLSSQGIIHGGLKYTLHGLLHRSAVAISQMPERWRQSLAGTTRPLLQSVRVRSEQTWMWRSESLSSSVALLGARFGLRSRPIEVSRAERPSILTNAPGTVYRVAEPVLDTESLVKAFFTRHANRMVAVDGVEGLAIDRVADRHRVRWKGPDGTFGGVAARDLVLAAGAFNEPIRARLGLRPHAMQRRPLHMTLVRGAPSSHSPTLGHLPELHGHCVDGRATRVTITTSTAADGSTIWQVGGQLAESGVALEREPLIQKAIAELRATVPDLDPRGLAWATYRIDRAESATKDGVRPDDAQCVVGERDGLMTIWPTKLALAPRAAALVLDELSRTGRQQSGPLSIEAVRPTLGRPPWEDASWSGTP